MNILITGGTGMIGQALVAALRDKGHGVRILSRSPKKPNEYAWDIAHGTIDLQAVKDIDGVVHLAGAGIADKRWTKSRKKEIIDSRVKSARLLKSAMRESGAAFRFFITASGANYYGTLTSEKIYRETDPPADDFLGRCCELWEQAAFDDNPADRVVALRTGVVLSAEGGALEKISAPVRWGVGAPLGSGGQYVPWIHLDDLVAMYVQAIEYSDMEGAYNAVADEQVNQKQLTKGIAKVYGRKLWLPHVPAFALRLVLGEMSNIILKGSRLANDKVKKQGFRFQYPQLEEALRDLIKSP